MTPWNQVRMSEIRINYKGELKCSALHTVSGKMVETEPGRDNHGAGGGFAPTDLLAAALGASMETSIALVAAPKGIDLNGLRVVVRKEISEDLPRRVAKLEVEVYLPVGEDHPEKKILQSAALGCPVRHTLHADTAVRVSWFWRQLPLPQVASEPDFNETEGAETADGENDTSWLDRFKGQRDGDR